MRQNLLRRLLSEGAINVKDVREAYRKALANARFTGRGDLERILFGAAFQIGVPLLSDYCRPKPRAESGASPPPSDVEACAAALIEEAHRCLPECCA